MAIFRQKFFRLSVTPNSVVKCVESTSTMSPARCLSGGIHSRQLNSVLPAAVNGCGRSSSIGWRASSRIALLSFVGDLVVRQVAVETERRDVLEQPELVEVAERRERRDFLRAPDPRRTQSPGVVHRNAERLHQRAAVLREALLARHQRDRRDAGIPSGAASDRR